MSHQEREGMTRRGFVGWVGMLGSVAASYTLFGIFALRFIFPRTKVKTRTRMFVGFADDVQPGDSKYFSTPDGEEYVLTNTASGAAPFQAYSSRCPHLGCRVHWEADNNRYFCPCHGGAFDQRGHATLGPPAKAGQRLKPCDIERDGSSLYAVVELSVNPALNWFRRRVPIDPDSLRAFGAEPVPEHLKHWWWCLGGTAAYLFIVQVVTGIMLAFHYVPEPGHAYESVQRINEVLPFGWYLRSLHRWSSNFMIVAVMLHMLRVFFTGAYRAPREINWVVGCGLLLTTLVFGFTGYSLVYEQLSYWGATVAGNITEAVPLIGPPLANFIRGGDAVGASTLTRFYVFHIGVLPTLVMGLLVVHLALIRLLGVTEFKFERSGAAKTFPFFPDHFITELAVGLSLMFLMTILAIVFPVGLADKADPLVTPAHIKPEWYFFFTFRWLKLTSLTFAVLSVGFCGFLMAAWPFVDRWLQKKTSLREVSILVGLAAFVAFIALTLWEAWALFTSH